MELSQDQILIGLSILLGLSELIALSPKFKSNSVLQLVIAGLKKVINKKEKQPDEKIEDIAKDLTIDAIIDVIEDKLEKHKK